METDSGTFDITPEPPPAERDALLAALREAPAAGSEGLAPWAEAGLREATERDPAA